MAEPHSDALARPSGHQVGRDTMDTQVLPIVANGRSFPLGATARRRKP